MKIALLYAAMPGYDFKLQKIARTIEETLQDLSVEVNFISLAYEQLPFCDGIKSQSIERLISYLNQADGVILATTATIYASCGLMQTFLEHLYSREQDILFAGKSCFYVVCSPDASESFACEHLQRVVARLRGYDAGKLTIGQSYLNAIDNDPEFKEIIEKQTEDFYRSVSQKRRTFIPGITPVVAAEKPKTKTRQKKEKPEIVNAVEETRFEPLINENTKTIKTKEIYEKYSATQLSKEDEDQINEIANILEKKLQAKDEQMEKPKPAVKSAKKSSTCYDQTMKMTESFNPQEAIGLNTIFQLVVSGDENFEVNIHVHNKDCVINEGIAENADIIIITESKAWLEVLSGKLNCQTAFRVGRFKVRGNFVLLSRLDQIFKFG